MARCELIELIRLEAKANNQRSSPIPSGTDWQTLLVLNALAAPMYILFSGDLPSAAKYDLAIPGESLFVHPLPPMSQITAINVYPGAVPAGDAGEVAIIRVSEALLPAFVGALNA